MTTPESNKRWTSGDSYEPYVGRWSRLVAREFVRWLAAPSDAAWLDVGCGTGALSQAILELASPRLVRGVDPSEAFLLYARQHIQDAHAEFLLGDATSLPIASSAYDAVVSGLLLNFVPQPAQALSEMIRVVRKGGLVAAYVWDYAGQVQLMHLFWDAAVAVDPQATAFDDRKRFALWQPEFLQSLFLDAGLKQVEQSAITIPTLFQNFDDYWTPFLGGQGSAPFYVKSLSETQRTALRDRLQATLPFEVDGSLHLVARAWTILGVLEA